MLSAAADADRELTKESAFAVQYTCTCDNGDEYSLAVSLSFIVVNWYSYFNMKLFWPYILITEQCKSMLKPVGIEHTFWKPPLFLRLRQSPLILKSFG